ncbi:MAG: hypothetical protein IJ542_02870 [Clostridia bacterium]|nr:hypothetical protein [Clostridia bacterium]
MELEDYKDMFGVYFRVKEIRPTYSLKFNKRTKKLELHDENFCGAQLTFNFPITPQILTKIKSSMAERSNQIFRKIEEENQKNSHNLIENAIYYAKNTLLNN